MVAWWSLGWSPFLTMQTLLDLCTISGSGLPNKYILYTLTLASKQAENSSVYVDITHKLFYAFIVQSGIHLHIVQSF